MWDGDLKGVLFGFCFNRVTTEPASILQGVIQEKGSGVGGGGGKQPRPNKWYLKALRATKAKKGVIRSGATNLCWRKWYFGNDCRTGDSQAERS